MLREIRSTPPLDPSAGIVRRAFGCSGFAADRRGQRLQPLGSFDPGDASDHREVIAASESVGVPWRGLVAFLAGTSLRIGEALGLNVSDVDFLRRSVSVERQRLQAVGSSPLKSPKSRRVVPLGQVTVDALAAHLAAYPSDGALFLDELGEPLRYRRWRTLWEAAARTSGVDFTSHALRHFYASALIAGGASVKQVQERLGHSSPVITLEIYAHLWPGEDDRTRDVMDAALTPLADSLRTRRA